MEVKKAKSSAKTMALVQHSNGTYTVLQCTDKESPAGFRSIVRRINGFPNYGRAYEAASRIGRV